MTCNDFRSHLEDSRVIASAVSADVSEHLTVCTHCRVFFEEQRDLQRELQFVRDSAPSIDVSLNARILGQYREHIAAAATRSGHARGRILPLMLSWKAALAVAAVAVIAWGFVSREHRKLPAVNHPQTIAQSPVSQSTPTPTIAPTVVAEAKRPRPRVRAHVRPAPVADPVNAEPVSLADGFRGLMICDALSCPDTMEMIRVQLPPAFAGFAPASTSRNGAVFADVLVGSDGIARGIRIIQ